MRVRFAKINSTYVSFKSEQKKKVTPCKNDLNKSFND